MLFKGGGGEETKGGGGGDVKARVLPLKMCMIIKIKQIYPLNIRPCINFHIFSCPSIQMNIEYMQKSL